MHMANSAPTVQGYMLQVAATRLTPEKFALLNYKLATGSPTAAQITACIKPGEWEAVVGDTREFNDIKWRHEAAIDAWEAGDPQSKGFVWPPQVIKLNLTDAAAKLSKITTDSTSPVSIVRAGAAGKIPVHWFNDLHSTTYIADFTCSPQRDLRGTDSDGPQQLTRTSLGELAVAESIMVMEFEFTDQDFAVLEKIKGKAVDDDGNLLGYRHLATKDGTVTISRDQLFVYEHDLKAYADTLAPATVAVVNPQTAHQPPVGVQVQAPAPKTQGVVVHLSNHKPKSAMAARIIEAMEATGSDVPSLVFVALREGAALNGDEPFTGVTQQIDGNNDAPLGSLQFKDLCNQDQWLTPQKLKDRIRNIKKSKKKA
jgi:hypothetical protein